ncbi:MAG: dienelactone hydrolase family protein [Chloroflexota bacterium]
MGSFETLGAGDLPARSYNAGDFREGAPGVIVLHPWWGLNDDVISYADRLAAEGFAVAAPDMFGGQIATTIEDAEKLAHAADEDAINGIVLAAVDRLSERVGANAKVAALGFSFGAHWSMWLPTVRDAVVGSVLYYGTTDGPVLTAARVPVLGHFAEDDPYETAEWVAEFEGTIRAAGRDVVIHRYPGTGHWFAEPSRDAYQREAADLAFERTVAFLRAHLG